MAKASRPATQQQATEYIQNLEPRLREVVIAIRKIFLESDKEIAERIK